MMSKLLATLLPFAAFVSMAANAPGRIPAALRSLAAPTADADASQSGKLPGYMPAAGEGFDIAEWLDDENNAMNAGRTAGNQFELSALDLSFGASNQAGTTFEPEDLGQVARLAALDPSVSNQFAGGPGRARGAFESLVGSRRGGSGGAGGNDTGDAGTGPAAGDNNQGVDNDEPATNAGESTEPTDPTEPVVPAEPTGPTDPTEPTIPSVPTEPSDPIVAPPVSVPEPASMGLLGLGLIGLSLAKRRRSARQV